jgi:curved DNA-binding protein CbpA
VTELNYYEILALPKDANKTEIKKAYYALAKYWHPDKNDDPNAEEMVSTQIKIFQSELCPLSLKFALNSHFFETN